MGLLSKALQVERNGGGLLSAAEVVAQTPTKKKSDAAAAVLAQLREIDPSQDDIPAIFSILQSAFGISKGSILLFDQEQRIFAPAVSVGFDRTTENRLRVPQKVAIENEILTMGSSMKLSGRGVESFRQFFSMREFGQIDSITLCPLISDGDLIGIVLSTESQHLPENDECSAVMGQVAKLISAHRGLPSIESHEALELSDESDPAAELDHLIKAAAMREKAVILFRITIADAVDYICRYTGHTEPFRVRQDIIRILSSLVSEIGIVASESSATLLLAITTRKTTSSRLFAHQITQAIRTFFRDVGEDLPLVVQTTRRYPDDGESAETLLSHWE